MKLSILICFTIAAVGLILNIKHTNPYFNPKKSHHTATGFKNPYLISDDQRKSFSDLLKMMTTERPKPKIKSVKQLNVDSVFIKIKKGKNFITWVGPSRMLLHFNEKMILPNAIVEE